MMHAYIILLPAFLLCFGAGGAKTEAFSYEGYKVYRFTAEGDTLKKLTENLQDKYDIWKEPIADGDFMDVMVSPAQEPHFKQLTQDLNPTLLINNVKNLLQDDLDRESSYKNSAYNDSQYYPLEEIEDFMYEMYIECGSEQDSLCQLFDIGSSYESRPIEVIKVGREGADRRAIWIDCGIHAREWISPATCQYIINQLVTTDGTDADTTALRNAYDWYVHPVVNVDGYAYTWTDDRLWRKTRKPNEGSDCVGTDGNRNFIRGWGGTGSTDDPCSQTYRGTEAFSESETRAIDEFVRPIGESFDIALTIHSYGQFFVYPWGYTTDEDPENVEDMAEVAAVTAAAITAVHGEEYDGRRSNGDMAGNTIDWAHGEANISYAYLFELRDTGDYGFLLPPDQIKPTAEEIWAGVKAMVFAVLEKLNP